MPREHMVVICVRWLEKQVFLGRLEGLHHVRPATEGCVFDNRSLVMCSHLEVGVRELSGSLNSNSPPDNAADHNREEKHDWSFALCLSPPVIFFSQQQGGRVWRRLSVNHTADRNQTRLQSFPKQQHKKALIKHELRHCCLRCLCMWTESCFLPAPLCCSPQCYSQEQNSWRAEQ